MRVSLFFFSSSSSIRDTGQVSTRQAEKPRAFGPPGPHLTHPNQNIFRAPEENTYKTRSDERFYSVTERTGEVKLALLRRRSALRLLWAVLARLTSEKASSNVEYITFPALSATERTTKKKKKGSKRHLFANANAARPCCVP